MEWKTILSTKVITMIQLEINVAGTVIIHLPCNTAI